MWNILPINIYEPGYFKDHPYFEGEIGNTSCVLHGGSNIFTKEECQTACEKLGRNYNPADLRNRKACYIGANNWCRQTGKPGPKSSLVCKRKGNFVNTFRILEFKQYKHIFEAYL